MSVERLKDKSVLIVDDDMRNIFALTTVLDEHEPLILSADNGLEAIRIVAANPDIDIVLMDVMMPDMDGYRKTLTKTDWRGLVSHDGPRWALVLSWTCLPEHGPLLHRRLP
jgi:PleD family two-component response regulator